MRGELLVLVLAIVTGVSAVAPDPRVSAAVKRAAAAPHPLTDPLPPKMKPEDQESMLKVLRGIEAMVNRVADDNHEKVQKVHSTAKAMELLHGEHHPQVKRAFANHGMVRDLRHQQIEAVLCGLTTIAKAQYPPAGEFVKRIAERHGIDRINVAFCNEMYGPNSQLDFSQDTEVLKKQLQYFHENLSKRVELHTQQQQNTK